MPALREEAKVRSMPREHTEMGTASGRATAQGRPRLLPSFYEHISYSNLEFYNLCQLLAIFTKEGCSEATERKEKTKRHPQKTTQSVSLKFGSYQ